MDKFIPVVDGGVDVRVVEKTNPYSAFSNPKFILKEENSFSYSSRLFMK